jgi:hypothetical protein
MNLEELIIRISKLEFHQSLLLKMARQSNEDFYKLVIAKSIGEEEVKQFYLLCDELSIKLEEQKAEGFVHFHPLLKEFESRLHSRLKAKEVILACLKQRLFVPLMTELKNYL